MGIEIERKFLLRDDRWRNAVGRSIRMQQGYLGGERCSTRVRIEGELAFLNIKSLDLGSRRLEFEYPLPLADAEQMLQAFAGPQVVKVRHHVPNDKHLWEIDEFGGRNSGLLVAEIELQDENEDFIRPDWLGDEVTHDQRYYNARLAHAPFVDWIGSDAPAKRD